MSTIELSALQLWGMLVLALSVLEHWVLVVSRGMVPLLWILRSDSLLRRVYRLLWLSGGCR